MATWKERILEVFKETGLDVAINLIMQRFEAFAQKGLPEHRVEMFFEVLVQYANKYGEAKRNKIIRRWMDRQYHRNRQYPPHTPYRPLDETRFVFIYTDNQRFLDMSQFLHWVDEITSMTDEEHDAVLEAYVDDKWDRLAHEVADALEPVDNALANIPGAASPQIFRFGEHVLPWWATTLIGAVIVTFVIYVLSY